MKTTILLTTLTVATIVNSCTSIREKSAAELLENGKMRKELFTSILNNRSYTSQFIDSLAKNIIGREMLLENDSLIKEMCISPKLENLLNTDSLVWNHMTKSVIKKMEIDSVACDRTCTQLMETKRIKDFLKGNASKK